MKKSLIAKLTILAFNLIIIGIVICFATGQTLFSNSIKDYGNVKMTSSGSYDISKNKTKSLLINSDYSSIEIGRSKDNKIHYEFYADNKENFIFNGITVKEENDPIAIEVLYKKPIIGLSGFSTARLKVLVPDNLKELNINTSIGNISVNNIKKAFKLDASSRLGSINLKNLMIKDEFHISTSMGSIKLDNVKTNEFLIVDNSMGDIKLNEVYAKFYVIDNSMGDIKINNKDKLNINRENINTSLGSVKINEGEGN